MTITKLIVAVAALSFVAAGAAQAAGKPKHHKIVRADGVVEHVGQTGAEDALPASVQRMDDAGIAVPCVRLAPIRGARAPARSARSPVHCRATAEACVARLGIAVVAAGADLLATLPRVERVVGPFDFFFAHVLALPVDTPLERVW